MNSGDAQDLADFAALQAGDDEAWSRLIGRWEERLYHFAWRYVRNATDARELTIEAFVRLHQSRHRLARDSRVAAWLFTTLANLCRNHHRWQQRHPTTELRDESDTWTENAALAEPRPAPDVALEQQEAIGALGAALDRLPHDLKAAVLLYYYERMSYREIGDVLGCSERGVETRLYRARQRLKGDLGDVLQERMRL